MLNDEEQAASVLGNKIFISYRNLLEFNTSEQIYNVLNINQMNTKFTASTFFWSWEYTIRVNDTSTGDIVG